MFLPQGDGKDWGRLERAVDRTEGYNRTSYAYVYRLLKCAGCDRGALAVYRWRQHFTGENEESADLVDFYPFGIDVFRMPEEAPEDVRREYREAEICAAVGALRAASALLRSALEKTLLANGYTKAVGKRLVDRIDAAEQDGLLSTVLASRAHGVRVLGNDVLHDPWREVPEEEYDEAHRYVQRVAEAFYDDRQAAEARLVAKGRLTPAPSSPAPGSGTGGPP